MAKIKYLLFDAANTLIHKPALWGKILGACNRHGVTIEESILQRNHKLLSELIKFPDRTSSEFYNQFNRELLYACGVIPSDDLIASIFQACSYLPWEPFEDCSALSSIGLPKGILSNFNTSLATHLNQHFPNVFSQVITSEELQCAKPAPEFFKKATTIIGIDPHEILFIGDSLKLDIEPALKAGFKSLLVDRPGYFECYQNRITSLRQLNELIDAEN